MAEAGRRPRPSARELALALVRGALILIALVVLYLLLPPDPSIIAPITYLAVGTAGFVAALIWQLHRIGRAKWPALQAVETLCLLLPLAIISFAMIYLSFSTNDVTTFSHPLNKINAVYFSVTVLTTTGFGDIVPVADYARAVVTFNMLANLVLLGVVVRLIARAVTMNSRARAA